MKLVIRDIYIDRVLELYKELFNLDRVPYDDETGIFKMSKVNLKIKAWNNNVEPLNKTGFNSGSTLANLFYFMSKMESYWYEFENESEDKKVEE